MEENAIKKRARLEKEIKEYAEKLKRANNALSDIDFYCKHKWGKTENADIYHEGYLIPGDPVGTMGVDRQLPCNIPSSTEKRWKRVCEKCGKVDYTKRVEEVKTEKPKW